MDALSQKIERTTTAPTLGHLNISILGQMVVMREMNVRLETTGEDGLLAIIIIKPVLDERIKEA